MFYDAELTEILFLSLFLSRAYVLDCAYVCLGLYVSVLRLCWENPLNRIIDDKMRARANYFRWRYTIKWQQNNVASIDFFSKNSSNKQTTYIK